jgi:ATP-dependent Clp protease ATP-binding subunit ClpC
LNSQIPKNSLHDDDEEESFLNKKMKNKNSQTPVLDTFTKDLTKAAKENKLDAVIGREKEIERVSQILSRRKKNNPIIIGEPGCVDGETFIKVRKVSDYGNHRIVLD